MTAPHEGAVGDARKRAHSSQAPTAAPISAPVDSGAIGRLNEAERSDLVAALYDYPHAGRRWLAFRDGVFEAVERILREHTDGALAEAVSKDRRSIRIDTCTHCGDLVISFGDGHWSHYRGPGSLLNRCQHSVPYGKDATPAKDGRYHQIVRAARQEQGR